MTASHPSIPQAKGSSSLVRARFGAGMLLRHDDLEQLNLYTRDLSRLLFKSLFGCGVVCGLEFKPGFECGKLVVTVGAGVALDCNGDPIEVPEPTKVTLDGKCDGKLENKYWVVLCGTEKSCAPRPSMCADDEEEMPATPTRSRAGFKIELRKEEELGCVCWCPPPDKPADGAVRGADAKKQAEECACVAPKSPCHVAHYDGQCGCSCKDCKDCDCDCVLLGAVYSKGDGDNLTWLRDHSRRRFIRPALLRDPAPKRDEEFEKNATKDAQHQVETQKQLQKEAAEREDLGKQVALLAAENKDLKAQLAGKKNPRQPG